MLVIVWCGVGWLCVFRILVYDLVGSLLGILLCILCVGISCWVGCWWMGRLVLVRLFRLVVGWMEGWLVV